MFALLSLSLSLVGTRLVAAVPLNTAIPFSPGFDFVSVASLAESLPSHSWEFGTAAEALLELYNPELSVFGSHPFPIPKVKSSSEVKALVYAASKIVIGTGANGLSDGDGAVGDPASLGVSAVMLGEIDGNETVANAAQEEVDYITTQAPRFWNGAISHRAEYAELWADFVYMAPPFLAYHAAVHNNITLLQETVTQLGLYRQILQSNSSSSSPSHGAWEHIIGPVNLDTGLWSTGNAWAAAGMTRVLATVLKAPVANAPKQLLWRVRAEKEITGWIKEILDAAIHSPMDNGLLRNYLNDTTGDGHGFGEISGSALLASVAYRMVVLQPLHFGIVSPYVKFAEGIRRTLGMGHVEGDGRVIPAVNPLGWGDTTPFLDGSPEGQNFVVLMYAAWRDCVRAGVCLLVG